MVHNADSNNYSDIAGDMIISSRTYLIMGAGNPAYDDNGDIGTDSKSSYYKYIGGKEL